MPKYQYVTTSEIAPADPRHPEPETTDPDTWEMCGSAAATMGTSPLGFVKIRLFWFWRREIA